MTTLVSGFIDLRKYDIVNRNQNSLAFKTLDFFLEKAKYVLKLPYPKVIFLEKENIDILKEYENENTVFVPFEKEDLFLWSHREEILKTKLPENRQFEKDTHDYMMVQLQKTDWVRRAIELDHFKTEQFVWIDLGIYWIVKNQDIFDNGCAHLVNCSYDKVRIPGCWILGSGYSFDQILWYFCGGLFGGNKDNLLLFHDLVHKKCLEILSYGRWMWENNIWYLVYLDNNELFDWYYGDHNITMIQNYS